MSNNNSSDHGRLCITKKLLYFFWLLHPCKVTSSNKNPPDYSSFSHFPLDKGQQLDSYRAAPSAGKLGLLMLFGFPTCHPKLV